MKRELKYFIENKEEKYERVRLEMTEKNGIYCLGIRVSDGEPVDIGNLAVKITYPVKGVYARWAPSLHYIKGITSTYRPEYYSVASSFPIYSYYGKTGENIFTLAFSDVINTTEIHSGIGEEDAEIHMVIRIFPNEKHVVNSYHETIYISLKDMKYYQAVCELRDLLEERYVPAKAPERAFEPMYSTWYSFHQDLSTDEIVQECKAARELGCTAVIVDDGWQTENSSRGYAYCGDWRVYSGKIPSMSELVSCIHELDMKFLLWYSVPFIGIHSEAYEKFKGMYLDDEDRKWNVPDPRFPEVREYIINIYKTALLEWDLDGFKLDFIDSFCNAEFLLKDYPFDERRDYEYVPDAVNRLMTDIMAALREIKADVLIEFRQSYIGPAMRTFGNMLRSGDCPADSLTNRINTVDLRLTSHHTAVHSDMIMFDPEEKPEFAALQLIDTIFSVPQISVKITELTEEQYAMMKYYLAFWRENRETLLYGEFMPEFAESNYPIVRAVGEKSIAVLNLPIAAKIDCNKKETILINATGQNEIFIDGTGRREYKILNCYGDIIEQGSTVLDETFKYQVPMAGMLILK